MAGRRTPPFFLLLLFLIIYDATAAQQITAADQDRQTLLRIKSELGNPQALNSWMTSAGGGTGDSHCTWTGVSCTGGSVTGISLGNLGLNGGFPASVCDLDNLLYIDFYNNSIAGPFPTSLYKCSKLQSLNISENYFGGVIPDDINRMSPSLVYLILSGNTFTGSIPTSIGRLPSIKFLHLDGNRFNGSIPAEIGNLTALEELWLADNKFTPSVIPDEFGKLTKLTSLWMRNNSLIGEIPNSLQKLTELGLLDFATNSLVGTIPPWIWSLKKLQYLYLFTNNFSGEIKGTIEAQGLVDIDVSSNNLTGSIPEGFGQLKNLRVLSMYYNKLTGQIPSSIGMLPSLYDLSLFDNKLTGVLPPDLGKHSGLWNFEVSNNKLSGELPEGLCINKILTDITVYNNNLTGKLPASVGHCPALDNLQIYGNKFYGEFPSGIWSAVNLTTVLIHDNDLSGTLPERLQPKLNRLEMWNNRFSGKIPSIAPGLAAFRASNNHFSGEIPASLVGLTKLNTLELKGNEITGEIPQTISSLQHLNVLDLSNNKLTGEIPVSIANLSLLTSLDLSKNQLSGAIPDQIGDNLKLNLLNLSANHLSGEVPSSLTVYGQSFFDNPGLCSYSQLEDVNRCSHSRRSRVVLLIILVVLTVVMASIALLGCLMIVNYNKRRKNDDAFADWNFTPFHKVDFTESSILYKLTSESLIGSGGAGQVYKVAVGNGSGDVVAVKKIYNTRKLGTKLDKQFEAEVQVLGSIRHYNIVKLLCSISSSTSKLLVYEYMENGSLYDWLHERKKSRNYSSFVRIGSASDIIDCLDWPTRLKIAVGAAQGLCYMHHGLSQPVVHRDIKSSNILLDSEFNSRIADFGLAHMLVAAGEPDSLSTFAGSFGYMAPECAKSRMVTEKMDVFSFGVVLLELVTGREANHGDDDKGLVDWAWRYIKKGGLILDAIDEEIRDPTYLEDIDAVYRLGLSCTSSLPNNRPSMKCVLDVLLHCQQALENGERLRQEYDVAPLLQFKKGGSRCKKSCDADEEEEDGLLHLV